MSSEYWILVSNGIFSTIAVVNPSRMTRRRIFETIGIRYEDIAVLPAILADIVADGDIVITMGADNIGTVAMTMAEQLCSRGGK